MSSIIQLVKIILPSHILLFAQHYQNIIIGEQIYHGAKLIDNIQIKLNAFLQANSAIISFLLPSRKQFNGGEIEIYDYDLGIKQILFPSCFKGKIIATEFYDNIATIKALDNKRALNHIITRTYNSNCQAEWGDTKCTVNKENFKQHIKITNIMGNIIQYTILDGAVDYFYNPYLQDDLGNIIPILYLNHIQHEIYIEPIYSLILNNNYYLYGGCQKNITNCQSYDNSDNYLGFL